MGEVVLMGHHGFSGYVLPGGGPWLIERWCPAMLHNTVRAATRGAVQHRCKCPRALVLAEKDRKAKSAGKHIGNGEYPTYIANVNVRANSEWPDLSAGACNNAEGKLLVDAYMAASSDKEKGTAKALKSLCRRCPVVAECAAMVLKFELPGGAWDGIYAGMTAADRRAIWTRKQEKRADTRG
jgi:hypothetical protein